MVTRACRVLSPQRLGLELDSNINDLRLDLTCAILLERLETIQQVIFILFPRADRLYRTAFTISHQKRQNAFPSLNLIRRWAFFAHVLRTLTPQNWIAAAICRVWCGWRCDVARLLFAPRRFLQQPRARSPPSPRPVAEPAADRAPSSVPCRTASPAPGALHGARRAPLRDTALLAPELRPQ